MHIPKITKQYLDAKKVLMPLAGRNPIVKEWTDLKFDRKIINHQGNLGWVLGKGDFVLDMDPRNGGNESMEKLLKHFNLELEPTVVTPRGGLHYYMKIPEAYLEDGYKFKKVLNKQYPGLDFITKGGFVVICGCSVKGMNSYTWADSLLGIFEQHPVPEEIMELVAYIPGKKKRSDGGDDDLGDFEGLIGGESSRWPEDKVIAMLDKLDHNMPNNEWVKVGMALHDWDPLDGLELWENWSKGGITYEKGECAERWKSFDLDGGVTLGTINYMVKEVNYDEENVLVNKFIGQIMSADEKELKFNVIPQIKKNRFDNLNKEKIVKAIQERIRSLSNVRMPINNIRVLITPDNIVKGHFVGDEEIPEWCRKWVYVNSHGGFMDIETLKLHKTESFNVENGKYVPLSDGGTRVSAAKYVSDRGFVSKAEEVAYLPAHNDLIVEMEGSKILNIFNPRSVPVAASLYTPEGKAAIKRVEKHIRLLIGSDENAQFFTEWLAHNVQYPGKQILFAPVIQSIQGIGKTFFSELLRRVMGDRNIGVVSPTQVTSDFNGWATGVCINILEELRVKGHSRYDAVNAVKPLITDRVIQINTKGVNQFMTYNTTNYLCFTNFRDAIPLDGDDRRWWVIFVLFQSLLELQDAVGEKIETYFPRLFDGMTEHNQEVRKWLLEYPISDNFLRTKQAPMTDAKRLMIATEKHNVYGLVEAASMIAAGGDYFNSEIVSSTDLFDAMQMEYEDLNINTTARHVILKQLGYMSAGVMKIDGRQRGIWVKKYMNKDEIKTALLMNRTLVVENEF